MSEVTALLDTGDRLLANPQLIEAHWLRGIAALYRCALEQAMRGFWERKAPRVGRTHGRNQLLCLSAYANEELAGTATHAWNELSAMVHHRSALGPDRGAVQRLGEMVRRIAIDLSRQSPTRGTV